MCVAAGHAIKRHDISCFQFILVATLELLTDWPGVRTCCGEYMCPLSECQPQLWSIQMMLHFNCYTSAIKGSTLRYELRSPVFVSISVKMEGNRKINSMFSLSQSTCRSGRKGRRVGSNNEYDGYKARGVKCWYFVSTLHPPRPLTVSFQLNHCHNRRESCQKWCLPPSSLIW